MTIYRRRPQWTGTRGLTQSEDMGQADEQRRLLTEVATTVTGLLDYVRREYERCQAATDEDAESAAVMEQILRELEPIAQDLAVLDAVRVTIDRHGGGPYSIEDLAAIAGVPEPDARRIVEQLVRDGMATREQDPGGPG